MIGRALWGGGEARSTVEAGQRRGREGPQFKANARPGGFATWTWRRHPRTICAIRSLCSIRQKYKPMPTANDLPDVLETTGAERLATGFSFTEGPLWHPDGYWFFVDLRRNMLFRLTPGKEPELVRTTIGGNGTTFDLQGRLIVCEGDDRRLTRMGADGKVESLVDNYKGGRFNRPNDVICHSNGCLYFTDPDKRRPYHEREIPGPAGENNLWDGARVYRLAPDGNLSVLANCEYPNRLALSPDEHTMYVANTRSRNTSMRSASMRPATWWSAASSPT